MRFTKALVLVFIGCLAASVSAQNVQKTLEKPWGTWSKEEAMKIISAQPFADQYQSDRGLASAAMQQAAREQADNRISGSNRGNLGRGSVPAPIVIRLHSALPVRQAMVRLQQIEAGYDKMNQEDRKKLDDSRASFIACKICTDYYVVTLTKFKDSSGAVDDGILQTLTFADLKGKIWLLNDKNEKRELAQFNPPKGAGDSAVFYFKRIDDKATAFLTPESKMFKFVFDNTLLDNDNAYSSLLPRNFEFKVSKIVVGDKVEF